MALPTFVANSPVVAVAASATCSYPAGVVAGDLLLMLVSTDGTAISTPAGFTTAGATTTGGGASVAAFRRVATGTETGTVASAITGGTKGAATIAAYRPAAGDSLSVAVFSGGADTDGTTTAVSIPGGSFTTQTNDLLGVFGLVVAAGSGAFSAVAASDSLTQAGATLGAQTGRVAGRTATDTLYYVLRDAPVTTGGTGAPSYSATAQGANATGAARFFAIRATPMRSNAGPDQLDVGSFATVTLSGSGSTDGVYAWRQVSGPTVALSSTTVAAPTFTSPAAVDGAGLVFGLTVGATPSVEDTVNVQVRPHSRWFLSGGVLRPVIVYTLP